MKPTTSNLSPMPGALGAVPVCRNFGRPRYSSKAEARAAAGRLPVELRAADPVVTCASHFHVIPSQAHRV